MKLAFIEEKLPDMGRIETLLSKSASANYWANRGPLYRDLALALADYTNCGDAVSIVPLANGGTALEAMARFFSVRAGIRQRWVASAFSYQNIGRGYFGDAIIVDCTREGLLDLDACERLDPDSFDGLIITNPFGVLRDFTKYAEFARTLGKSMIIDNAAGFHKTLPEWPWQAFSFHHTKPYGAGEGGAALVPSEHAETIYELVDYAADYGGSLHWLGNGKISDLSCAFILERLEKADNWVPRYVEQKDRVMNLADRVGLVPLSKPQNGLPMTSLPLLFSEHISLDSIRQASSVTLAKYYKPLKNLPKTSDIYGRIVNVPCHPNVKRLTDEVILTELARLVGNTRIAP